MVPDQFERLVVRQARVQQIRQFLFGVIRDRLYVIVERAVLLQVPIQLRAELLQVRFQFVRPRTELMEGDGHGRPRL